MKIPGITALLEMTKEMLGYMRSMAEDLKAIRVALEKDGE